MDPFYIKAIQLFCSLSLLIVLHEMGHFIPAKLFKTRVEKFYLFFDVKFSLLKKKIGDTVYGIGWLPLGGYVKIAGMVDESMDKDQMAQEPKPWEFRSKPAWQRLIIMLGGVTVNILLGFVIYMMVLFVWGTKTLSNDQIPDGLYATEAVQEYGFQQGDHILAINGKPQKNLLDFKNRLKINKGLMMRDVKTVTVRHRDGNKETISLPDDIGSQLFQKGAMPPFSYLVEPVVEQVQPGSPAEKAGLKEGDRFVSVDGIAMKTSQDFNQYKAEHPDKSLNLEVSQDDGTTREVAIKTNEDNLVGVGFKRGILNAGDKSYSLGESISAGFSFGYWTLHDYVAQFKYVFTKKGATQVGGFGAIGSLFPNQWHWQAFWMTTAFLSIILAFMNILPIPALDGGHVMFLLYEIVAGRKPNEKFLEYAQMVGFFILIALVLFANGNDIYRYFFE